MYFGGGIYFKPGCSFPVSFADRFFSSLLEKYMGERDIVKKKWFSNDGKRMKEEIDPRMDVNDMHGYYIAAQARVDVAPVSSGCLFRRTYMYFGIKRDLVTQDPIDVVHEIASCLHGFNIPFYQGYDLTPVFIPPAA